MSGALLETAGQVRNAYPYINTRVIQVTNQWTTAAPGIVAYSAVDVVDNKDLPFDKGPDKSGRVFAVINGYSIIASADSIATPPQIIGHMWFRDNIGERHLLHTFVNTFSQLRLGINSDRVLVPAAPIFSAQNYKIGTIEWENIISNIGTIAAVNNIITTLNIGYYNDYAEYDFDKITQCTHIHHNYAGKETETDMTKV